MKLSTAKSLMKFWKAAKLEIEKMKVDGTIKLEQLTRKLEELQKKDR